MKMLRPIAGFVSCSRHLASCATCLPRCTPAALPRTTSAAVLDCARHAHLPFDGRESGAEIPGGEPAGLGVLLEELPQVAQPDEVRLAPPEL